ncbi:hypothetical protein AB3S75_021223 [Citrus x aurantiifolia]
MFLVTVICLIDDYSKGVSFIGKDCLCRALWDYSNTFVLDCFQNYWGFSSSDICANFEISKEKVTSSMIV